ncbi:MAG: DUF932 domain-containing protein, partial [Candidatus Methylomirabilales bacterium]
MGDEGAQAPDFHAVVREDTGAVLGIHRGSYKLVPNRAIFEPFEEAITQSGIALEGISVQEGIAYAGRTVVREYTFPAVTLEPRVGDVVEFKMKVVNSYDATNAFRALMGGRRRLCLNGMVGQEQHALAYARHTNGFSSQRAVDGIRKAMERYLALDGEWKRWAGRPITAEAAGQVFEAMPGSNPRRLEVLTQAWKAEVAAAGPTVWALYNALTRNADSLIMPHESLGSRSSRVKEMIWFGIKLRPGLLVHLGPR